jgi:hypothetical protein
MTKEEIEQEIKEMKERIQKLIDAVNEWLNEN